MKFKYVVCECLLVEPLNGILFVIALASFGFIVCGKQMAILFVILFGDAIIAFIINIFIKKHMPLSAIKFPNSYIEITRLTPFSVWEIHEISAKKSLDFPNCEDAINSFKDLALFFSSLPLGKYKMLTHSSIVKKLDNSSEIHVTKSKPIGKFSREFIRSALIGKSCK